MPEIWIPYGAVEVAVDIRAENLLGVIERAQIVLGDEEIRQKIAGLKLSGKVGIFVADDQEACLRVARAFANMLVEKNIPESDVQFMVSKKSANIVRKKLEGIPFKVSTLSAAEGKQVNDVYGGSNTKILLSEVGFDALFGFSGGVVSMLRALGSRVIGDAFLTHPPQKPSPGSPTEAYAMLLELADQITDVQSIVAVASQDDVADVIVGDARSIEKAAQEKILSIATRVVAEKARGAIVSPGGRRVGATLSSSVRSLWNVLGGLRDRSAVAILSECTEGLGSEAFKLYGTGRLDLNGLSRMGRYVEGLEDLVFLREVSQIHEILLVSSLPNYYVETKFNLKSGRKASEGLSYLLSTLGQRTRVLIVPQASEVLLKS